MNGRIDDLIIDPRLFKPYPIIKNRTKEDNITTGRIACEVSTTGGLLIRFQIHKVTAIVIRKGRRTAYELRRRRFSNTWLRDIEAPCLGNFSFFFIVHYSVRLLFRTPWTPIRDVKSPERGYYRSRIRPPWNKLMGIPNDESMSIIGSNLSGNIPHSTVTLENSTPNPITIETIELIPYVPSQGPGGGWELCTCPDDPYEKFNLEGLPEFPYVMNCLDALPFIIWYYGLQGCHKAILKIVTSSDTSLIELYGKYFRF